MPTKTPRCVMLEAINANCTTVDCGGTERLGGQCARLDTLAFVRAGHMSEDFCSWLNLSVGLMWGIYAAFRLVVEAMARASQPPVYMHGTKLSTGKHDQQCIRRLRSLARAVYTLHDLEAGMRLADVGW